MTHRLSQSSVTNKVYSKHVTNNELVPLGLSSCKGEYLPFFPLPPSNPTATIVFSVFPVYGPPIYTPKPMSTNATPSQPTFQSLLDLLSATAPQCRILALLIFLAPASLLLAAVTVYRADLNNIRPPDPTAHVSSPWAAEAAFGSVRLCPLNQSLVQWGSHCTGSNADVLKAVRLPLLEPLPPRPTLFRETAPSANILSHLRHLCLGNNSYPLHNRPRLLEHHLLGSV